MQYFSKRHRRSDQSEWQFYLLRVAAASVNSTKHFWFGRPQIVVQGGDHRISKRSISNLDILVTLTLYKLARPFSDMELRSHDIELTFRHSRRFMICKKAIFWRTFEQWNWEYAPETGFQTQKKDHSNAPIIIFFCFYCSTPPAFLMNLLSLRLVGTVGARDYMWGAHSRSERSSSISRTWTQDLLSFRQTL